jgi:hypothetical protein
MLASDLQEALMNWTVRNSLHQENRGYIGLSEIADCEAVIYDRYLYGKRARVDEHCLHRMSYEMEWALIRRLTEMGLYKPAPEICLFDGLVQGHPDGFIGNELLEIKTLPREEWLPKDHILPKRIWFQVQAYLHYTDRGFAQVVYLARDTGIVSVVAVKRKVEIGETVAAKVERLAHAVRALERPGCTCGRCIYPTLAAPTAAAGKTAGAA